MAGKRLGKEDDRHLWPEMLRAIREIKPRWVVGENVLGLVNWSGGLVFHEVQADLEAEGYEVQPFVLPAVSVNAPHRRDRVWFVAKNTRSDGRIFRQPVEEGAEVLEQRNLGARDTERVCGEEMAGIATDTTSKGREEWFCVRGRKDTQEVGSGLELWSKRLVENGNAADTYNTGLQRLKIGGSVNTIRKGSHEQPTRFLCTTFENFPTQSPVCHGNDGFSSRLDGITFSKWRQESIKAGGNAVVPQVVLQIFKAIAEYEKLTIQRPSI